MGEAIDQPTGGNARHPGADQGNALPAEKKTVIAIAQGPQHETESLVLQEAGAHRLARAFGFVLKRIRIGHRLVFQNARKGAGHRFALYSPLWYPFAHYESKRTAVASLR